MNYNGRDKAGQEKNAGTNWLIYTLGMGVLPLIIKFLIGCIYTKPLKFDDYCVELFFMTIVFLIGAIRNFSTAINGFAEKVTALILTLCAAIYGSILVNQIKVSEPVLGISNLVLQSLTIGFLILSFILDIGSMKHK